MTDAMLQAIDAGLRSFCADTPDFTMSPAMRRDAIDHIIAQPGIRAALDWLPIETAPEDGNIDLWAGCYYHKCCRSSDGIGWVRFHCYTPNRDISGKVTSWATHWRGVPEKPTHWRPMPEGPAV